MNDSLVLIKYLDDVYNTFSDNALKVSTPSSINDPFEMLVQVPDITDREKIRHFFRKFIEKNFLQFKGKISKEYEEYFIDQFISKQGPMFREYVLNAKNSVDINFISFSSKKANPQQEYIMWSLYSTKPGKPHSGFRLHFDSEVLIRNKPNYKLSKITYSQTRLMLDDPLNPLSPESQKVFMESLTLKSNIWSHECEQRLFIYPGIEDIWEKDGKRFIKYPPKSLKKVIFGYNFEINRIEEIKESLCADKKFNHVKLFKTELHPKNYELKYKLI